MEGERIIEPLMYIEQPEFRKPRAYMQEDYLGKQLSRDEKEDIEEDDSYDDEEDGGDEEEVEEESYDDSESSFKDLSLDEKIGYLTNIPDEMPQIKCEVVTEENKFRGIIIENDEETITMRKFGRLDQTIDKKDIDNIILIGF